MRERYEPGEFEAGWRARWAEADLFKTREEEGREKFYAADFFPYPSGAGLSVGHCRNYVPTDVLCRMKVMQGYNVLHPMGFDAFGLPAEVEAIKRKTHPAPMIDQYAATYRRQMDLIGVSYDWSRSFKSCDPDYYRWTQWIFTLLYKKGLAYRKDATVNWCPFDKTVLADEEVVGGLCWRCNNPVEKKKVPQWFFRITAYADRLVDDLDDLDWPEGIKAQQRNWIGRSEGVEFEMVLAAGTDQTRTSPNEPEPTQTNPNQPDQVRTVEDELAAMKAEIAAEGGAGEWEKQYKIDDITKKLDKAQEGLAKGTAKFERAILNIKADELESFQILEKEKRASFRVFTTRIDTIFGMTFCVLAPEHPLVTKIFDVTSTTDAIAMRDYIDRAKAMSDADRNAIGREKTGVFTGVSAINPANGKRVPIWIADYVMMGYGTGAIMAVPAHDERDFQFAVSYGLPVHAVIEPPLIGGNAPEAVRAFAEKHLGEKFDAIPYKGRLELILGILSGEYEQSQREKEWSDEMLADFAAVLSLHTNSGEPIPLDQLLFDIREEFFLMQVQSDGSSALAVSARYPDLTQTLAKGMAIKYLNHHGLVHDSQVIECLTRILRYFASSIGNHLRSSVPAIAGLVYSGKEGCLINSGEYSGLTVQEGQQKLTEWITALGIGEKKRHYKLRDWLISRQRYWGCPIPVIHQADGTMDVVRDQDLPVELPKVDHYEPGEDGSSPLAHIADFVNVTDHDGRLGRRETDTMGGFACSSWYFLRFCDPHNDQKAWDPERVKYWMPVDCYVGGAEHAVMHLLYARFWTKVLYDEGLVPVQEPFARLKNQGQVLGRTPYRKPKKGETLGAGEEVVLISYEEAAKLPEKAITWRWVRMSKSKGNVVTPDEAVEQFGADALRLFELFVAPFESDVEWTNDGMVGTSRFLTRVFKLAAALEPFYVDEWEKLETFTDIQNYIIDRDPHIRSIRTKTHKAIARATKDIEEFKFNTYVAGLMEFVNWLTVTRNEIAHGQQFFENKAYEPLDVDDGSNITHEWTYATDPMPIRFALSEALHTLILLLSPGAPHTADEIWAALGNKGFTYDQKWPQADPALTKEDTVTIAIQVNGKLRDTVELPADATQDQMEAAAKASEKAMAHTQGLTVRKTIVVPGKLVNIVAN